MDDSLLSARLRAAAEPIWREQMQQPFLRGLLDGTLPQSKFLFYMRQDVIFLREMNRVFGYGAARAGSPADTAQFARLLLETDEILAALHGRYVAGLGVSAADLAATPVAATTYAYSRHLLATATAGTYAALVTSLLPSMWMYDELGAYLATLPPAGPAHPYYEWLRVHAGDHLTTVTTWLRSILDRLPGAPAEEAHLSEVFRQSSRYEIAFWQMAWREEL
jgi:thiaminase/transcriptional activator TenA